MQFWLPKIVKIGRRLQRKIPNRNFSMEEDQQASRDTAKTTAVAPPLSEEGEPEIKLTNFRGLPFPGPPFDVDILKEVVEFKPEPTDIFVVTYPKCGTTWTQYIVWEIINGGAPPPSPNKMIFKHFPYLEMIGIETLHEMRPPRLFKTHLPFQFQPYHPSAKYIYVVRNPWDCCVSYYHHVQIAFPEDKKLPFRKFFDHFIQGKLPYGDFFTHVLSWYSHKDDSNVLFLTYENMSADRKGSMLTVAKFLGDHYYNVLKKDEHVLSNCLKYSEFKFMKDMGMFVPKEVKTMYKSKTPDKDGLKMFREAIGSVDKGNVDFEKFIKWEFFRKGIVGDWKNYFTENQIQRFNDYVSTKISDTDIEKMWILPQHQLE